ncbi:SIP domain-containing protein [Pseudonocardia sp. DLS-67]
MRETFRERETPAAGTAAAGSVRGGTPRGRFGAVSRRDAVRDLRPPDGPGCVDVAGEGAVTRSIRSHLRQERNLPRHACTAVAYWQAPTSRWSGGGTYSLDSRSAISGTTASSAKWIDSTEFVE